MYQQLARAAKASGPAHAGTVPTLRATPDRPRAIPRYMGLRVRANGPVVTSESGSSKVPIVVDARSNSDTAARIRNTPATVGDDSGDACRRGEPTVGSVG